MTERTCAGALKEKAGDALYIELAGAPKHGPWPEGGASIAAAARADPVRGIQALCPMKWGGVGASSLNIEL